MAVFRRRRLAVLSYEVDSGSKLKQFRVVFRLSVRDLYIEYHRGRDELIQMQTEKMGLGNHSTGAAIFGHLVFEHASNARKTVTNSDAKPQNGGVG